MGSKETAWIWLFCAGIFEIGWAIGLKQSETFTRLWPSVWTLATMAAAIVLLAVAMRHLPVGTAYAVWTGIGAIGVAAIGILFLGDPATPWRLASIGLIVLGIIGLRLS